MGASRTNAARRGRLEHFPINIFTMVMGLGGFAVATRKLEKVMGWTSTISLGLTFLSAGLLALLLLAYLAKGLRYPQAVRGEWRHPIKISFFPAVSISLLILSVCFLDLNRDISFWLWAVGTALQLVTALAVIRTWMRADHFEEKHLNPAWFIPAVGNVLVPIAGTVHGPAEISWFFFSFGMLFWVMLQTIILNRLIFHHPLPERLLPTLFIMIAPPAVGFLSYTSLEPASGLTPFARFLYFSAVLFFLLLATKADRLFRLKFGLPWWAYSFPMAALTLATFRYHELSGQEYIRSVGIGLYVLLAAIIALLLLRTLQAAMRHQICVPE
jgi:tellurite resistance protein